MAWTQADADNVQAAITALATGARVQTVSFNGPPARTVNYVPAQLGELRSLLAEINASLARAAGGKGYRLAAYRKGV